MIFYPNNQIKTNLVKILLYSDNQIETNFLKML